MARSPEDSLKATLARVAPGTALRDGLERILRGRTGALIVLGIDRTIESICSGGFEIGIDFSPTRLRELAKMDGAIVCDKDASNILRAAVQLVPDSSIETQESGTRHRTAERVAIQTGVPVISVSQSMQIIALYVNGLRHVLEGSEKVLARANQALATLERYRSRLDQVTSSLSALEIEAMVTVRDVAVTLQRQEMVRRISEEISQYVLELGEDGRLLSLQLDELTVGRGPGSDVIIRDYSGPARNRGGHRQRGQGPRQPGPDRADRPRQDRRDRRLRRRRGQPRRRRAAARLPPALRPQGRAEGRRGPPRGPLWRPAVPDGGNDR